MTGDHRETADTYAGELIRQDALRVVTCRDRFQWILQRRTRAASPAGARWEALAYCRSRAALLRLWRDNGGNPVAELDTLPDTFRPGAKEAAR
ncbi:hypothetical protein [Mangrovicoccus algicola]|uniref:Uncharacterized protein n=1 Tax=Mangrovicoccus algicola TaxID=2771008 RepID=A0A8J6YTV6_9RHOB|nr:hypothetical protein [Mangrovicoccus algicola]MBE3637432.1 hypothetical protein [Mangrovicoccus algicola]